jgi:hypothetical protein
MYHPASSAAQAIRALLAQQGGGARALLVTSGGDHD